MYQQIADRCEEMQVHLAGTVIGIIIPVPENQDISCLNLYLLIREEKT